MGLVQFHRRMKIIDLFAFEAKHYPSCLNLEIFPHSVHKIRAWDSQCRWSYLCLHVCMSASHKKVLVSVLAHIQTHVVQQNEVLSLSSCACSISRNWNKMGTRTQTIALRNYWISEWPNQWSCLLHEGRSRQSWCNFSLACVHLEYYRFWCYCLSVHSWKRKQKYVPSSLNIEH